MKQQTKILACSKCDEETEHEEQEFASYFDPQNTEICLVCKKCGKALDQGELADMAEDERAEAKREDANSGWVN
jgi:uncharacterized CHY-type Zn-finger protein